MIRNSNNNTSQTQNFQQRRRWRRKLEIFGASVLVFVSLILLTDSRNSSFYVSQFSNNNIKRDRRAQLEMIQPQVEIMEPSQNSDTAGSSSSMSSTQSQVNGGSEEVSRLIVLVLMGVQPRELASHELIYLENTLFFHLNGALAPHLIQTTSVRIHSFALTIHRNSDYDEFSTGNTVGSTGKSLWTNSNDGNSNGWTRKLLNDNEWARKLFQKVPAQDNDLSSFMNANKNLDGHHKKNKRKMSRQKHAQRNEGTNLIDRISRRIVSQSSSDIPTLEVNAVVTGRYFPPPEVNYPSILRKAINENMSELVLKLIGNGQSGSAIYFANLQSVICIDTGPVPDVPEKESDLNFQEGRDGMQKVMIHNGQNGDGGQGFQNDEIKYKSSGEEEEQQDISPTSNGNGKISLGSSSSVDEASTNDNTSASDGISDIESITRDPLSKGDMDMNNAEAMRNDGESEEPMSNFDNLKLTNGDNMNKKAYTFSTDPTSKALFFRTVSGLILLMLSAIILCWNMIRIGRKKNQARKRRILLAKGGYEAPFALQKYGGGRYGANGAGDEKYAGMMDNRSNLLSTTDRYL